MKGTMGSLHGKVAIITGASSGIGAAACRRFAREGAKVIAVARRRERLEALAAEQPQHITPFVCDVTESAGLVRLVAETLAAHGQLDILVNNAGFSYYERLAESTPAHYRETLAVNFEAMVELARIARPYLARSTQARIVNVSSTQSIASEAVVGAYAASKGAINAWTRALAVDLAPEGILVNAVLPGCTHTEMSIINGVDETQTPEFQAWYVERRKIPLARAGTADEIANCILFLSSDQCSYVTGHCFVADGGLTITF
jgi:NAD(P)-dependent dehydrogenase (short-subunit alcohol dehydrogenase family)